MLCVYGEAALSVVAYRYIVYTHYLLADVFLTLACKCCSNLIILSFRHGRLSYHYLVQCLLAGAG